ncbi:MAG: hypothetical protein JWL86_4991 [Rhizobium sp.]|nr:hypothetical protein [Rhizobium sp.]
MTLPGFIGIGAHKAGTTWLYQMLAQNPSVWLPPIKEVHFFDKLNPTPELKRVRIKHFERVADRIERSEKKKGSAGDSATKAAFLRSLAGDNMLTDEWYKSIFAHPDAAGKVSGEITPAYLDNATDVLPKISEMLPTTKFVLLVREPLSRSLSQIRMAISRVGKTPETTEDWEFYVKRLKQNLRGSYKTSIPLWRSFFGPERLLILPFGRLKHDPAGLLREVEDFIGAERFAYESMTEQVHKTKDVEIPQWVRDKAEELVRPQKDFLIESLGQDFYDATR